MVLRLRGLAIQGLGHGVYRILRQALHAQSTSKWRQKPIKT